MLRSSRQGFTLIELLIVIAIIGLLAAILFPAFGRVREMGIRSSCASNLKQITKAMAQYTQDYDEKYPLALKGAAGVGLVGGWMVYTAFDDQGYNTLFDPKLGGLYSYLKNSQVYICPTDRTGRAAGNSYALGQCVAGGDAGSDPPFYFGLKQSQVQNPAQTIMVSPQQMNRNNIESSSDDASGISCFGAPFNYCNTGYRHFGGENQAFADGHVKWYTPERVYQDGLVYGAPGATTCQ